MARIRHRGVLPGTLAEGDGPGQWSASLVLAGDRATLASVELTGPDGGFFSLRYDAALGLVTVAPGAPADYDSRVATGGAPELTFGLRYVFADGSVEVDPDPLRVMLVDRDDTPPQALGFATGGWVHADPIGAVIGTLVVTDPDSAGPFTFRFTEDDDWVFEVVDMTLRLRPGISLGLDDTPRRTLLIEVSDGTQSAAFRLDIQVLLPGAPPPAPVEPTPGHDVAGFADPGGSAVVALQGARDLAAVTPRGDGGRVAALANGAAVGIDAGRSLQLVDGRLDWSPAGAAARAVSLYQAVLGPVPEAPTLAELVAAAEGGTAWADLAAGLLADAPLRTDAAFIAALGGSASARLAGSAALAAGVDRAQVAVDLVLGGGAPLVPAAGIWVALPLGGETAEPITEIAPHPTTAVGAALVAAADIALF